VTVKENMIPSLIDEIPVLAAIAAVAEGKTVITGAGELKVKESNRIAAMVNEMRKLGVKIQELPDGMEIEGPNRIIGGTVESYGDHRIAMALAVCGLFADGDVSVANSDCITISFPQFAEILTEITS
jgi:3-phosphoshikimate 1-carboxyvinyltransferase